MQFNLSSTQANKIGNWKDDHECKDKTFTYEFTPISNHLGVVVHCNACNEYIDVTIEDE